MVLSEASYFILWTFILVVLIFFFHKIQLTNLTIYNTMQKTISNPTVQLRYAFERKLRILYNFCGFLLWNLENYEIAENLCVLYRPYRSHMQTNCEKLWKGFLFQTITRKISILEYTCSTPLCFFYAKCWSCTYFRKLWDFWAWLFKNVVYYDFSFTKIGNKNFQATYSVIHIISRIWWCRESYVEK